MASFPYKSVPGCQTPVQQSVWDHSPPPKKTCSKSISLCRWVRMPICTKRQRIKASMMFKLESVREVAGYKYSYKLFHRRCHYHVRVYLTVGSLFFELCLMQGGTHTTGKRNGSKLARFHAAALYSVELAAVSELYHIPGLTKLPYGNKRPCFKRGLSQRRVGT